MEEQFADFVDQHLGRILPVLDDLDHERPLAPDTLRAAFGDRVAFTRLRACHASDEIADPRLRRQANLLYLLFLPHQIDAELAAAIDKAHVDARAIFTDWRGNVGLGTVDWHGLLQTFRTSKSPGPRIQAFVKLREIAQAAAPKLLELASLRNRAARDLGFTDHFDLACRVNEFDPAAYETLTTALGKSMESVFAHLRRDLDKNTAAMFKTRSTSLHPWHLAHPLRVLPDPDEDGGAPVKDDHTGVAAFFKQVGFHLPAATTGTSASRRLDAEADVRWLGLVAAVRRSVKTLARAHLDPALPPLLRRPPHPVILEALRWFFIDELLRPETFGAILHLTPQKATPLKAKLRERIDREAVLLPRASAAAYHVVKNLYQNPGDDIAAHFSRQLMETLHIDMKDDERVPFWALLPDHLDPFPRSITGALGLLAAEQLRKSLPPPPEGRSLLRDADTLRLLKEQVLEPGLARSWTDTVAHLSGRPLGAEAYISRYAR